MSAGSPIRLAMAQILVEAGQVEANLERAAVAVELSASHGADIVVLPEVADLGWMEPAPDRRERDGGAATVTAYAELARTHRVFLCGGFAELSDDGMSNAAVLIDPSGVVRIRHRKINELEMARELYRTGTSLEVAETPLGTLGVMICADGLADGDAIARTLAMMGADLIVSPCAWAVPPDHDQAVNPYGGLWIGHYAATAEAFGTWIAGVSNVGRMRSGPWAGHPCIGNSMLVGPGGRCVAASHGASAAEVLLVDVPDGTGPVTRVPLGS